MAKRQTSIRNHLKADSSLQPLVRDRLDALDRSHRSYIDGSIHGAFVDSLNLDAALLASHPQANRWDYLLGLDEPAVMIGLEPHSAKDDEVQTVLKKRQAAIQHLAPHLLRADRKVKEWFWVASGTVKFAPSGKALFRLNQGGVKFVGRALTKKHLNKLAD